MGGGFLGSADGRGCQRGEADRSRGHVVAEDFRAVEMDDRPVIRTGFNASDAMFDTSRCVVCEGGTILAAGVGSGDDGASRRRRSPDSLRQSSVLCRSREIVPCTAGSRRCRDISPSAPIGCGSPSAPDRGGERVGVVVCRAVKPVVRVVSVVSMGRGRRCSGPAAM
jgi:hypothetical protein